MSLSAPRISHLSHRILDGLCRQGLLDCPDRSQALSILKTALSDCVEREDFIDQEVRRKLQKQNIPPGSPQWHKLFERYANEERSKRS